MTKSLDSSQLDSLQSFCRIADEMRAALDRVKVVSGELRVVDGYLESKDAVEHYRALCLPVRRIYRESDRASFTRVVELLRGVGSPEIIGRLERVVASYATVQQDIAGHTTLNDQELGHRSIFEAWLDAVIFGSFGGKDREYRRLVAECGKAVEGIAVRITETIAEPALDLADVVQAMLTDAGH